MSKVRSFFKRMGAFLAQLGRLIVSPFVFIGHLLIKGGKRIGKRQSRWVMSLVALISLFSFLCLVYLNKGEVGPATDTLEGGQNIEAVVILEEEEPDFLELVDNSLEEEEELEEASQEVCQEDSVLEQEEVLPVLVHHSEEEIIPTFTLNDLLAPINGEVVTPFGWHFHHVFQDWRFHRGIDIKAQPDTPVCAVWAGKVLEIKEDDYLGHMLIIEHGNDLQTIYGHLSKINVDVGTRIERGDQLALVSGSELSSAPHLHFELHHKGQALDPGPYYLGWREGN